MISEVRRFACKDLAWDYPGVTVQVNACIHSFIQERYVPCHQPPSHPPVSHHSGIVQSSGLYYRNACSHPVMPPIPFWECPDRTTFLKQSRIFFILFFPE